MLATANNPPTVGLLAPHELARRRLGLAVVSLLYVATWVLAHGYVGIEHDARLYTLQALARLRPDSLALDVFLKFGSQDRFTLFSPAYAAIIARLGVEHAAAVVTFTLQLAFFTGAALLARRVVAAPLALLGLGVLIAIPGFYGADKVFRCVEAFVTPRMGAEALVLFALAAALGARQKLALGLLAAALLLHPVMAATGFAALAFLGTDLPRPRWAVLLVGGGALLVAASFGRLDATWLSLIEARSPYVFLTQWSLEDWGRTAVPLATLAVGSRALESSGARNLCRAALWASLAGLALALTGCDGLRLTLVTQLQPWRWTWLAVTVAALLLPAITRAGWRSPPVAGKTTALLLAAAWLFASGPLALLTSLGAVASLGLQRWSARNELRLVLYGAVGLFLIALASRLASNLLFLEAFYADTQIPLWFRQGSTCAWKAREPESVLPPSSSLAPARQRNSSSWSPRRGSRGRRWPKYRALPGIPPAACDCIAARTGRADMSALARLCRDTFAYGLVSVVALGVDTSVLYSLATWAGWHYLAASMVAFAAGAAVAYLLSVRFVFPVRKLHNPYTEFVAFVALGLAGMAVNAAALFVAVSAVGLGLITAKLLAAGCTFATNFTLRRQLLFTPPKAP